jgi:hypothetical protein
MLLNEINREQRSCMNARHKNNPMKKIIYIAVAGVLSLSACKQDFLERPPLDQVSDATFWQSENDVYLAVNAIYNQLPGEGLMYQDGASDNAHAQYPWESTANAVSSGVVSTDLDAGWSFIAIRRQNYFMENVDKAEMDESLKERYKAEVRFMRAFSYQRMVENFGDVPLILNTLHIDSTNVARTPKAEVTQFILKELEEVAEILPASYAGGKGNERGRITRGAALALKARIHLYEGDWANAVAESEKVMNMGYSLFRLNEEEEIDAKDDYSNWVDFENNADEQRFRLGLRSYEGLFRAKNEGNSEVILDRQYIVQTDAQYLNTYLLPGTIGGWSSITPTQALVDAYADYKTGEPAANIPSDEQRAAWYDSKSPEFQKEYRNRDPRFYASILFEDAPWNAIEDDYSFTWSQGASNMSQTGYNFRKLVDPTAQRVTLDNHSNIIIFRYAEILLTYAEAKNELSGPDASVYDALDQIRTRSGMPVVDRAAYADQASLRELIRRERRVELALEGQRYMDIRRWEIAPQVMKSIMNIRNSLAQERIWSDKLYLMPVPQSQIDLSEGLLTQNKGYN